MKENGTILDLDLQNKSEHKQFVNIVAAGKDGALYKRFPNFVNAEILFSNKVGDLINKNLVSVITNQFPASITRLNFTSLASKAQSLTSYINALNYAETKVNVEF